MASEGCNIIAMLKTDESIKFLAVDFYCGAGGTTRGLLDAGGYVIAGIDNDGGCRTTYQRNNRNTALDCSEPKFLALDMFPTSPDCPQGQQDEVWNELNTLIPRYRSLAPGVPLLFAVCAPCQSFTKFVQRRMTDKREQDRERDQSLLSQTVGFIAKFQPELVISENVASIKSERFGNVWNDFQSQLRGLGYAIGERGICASRFGVPQYRRRSVMLGFKNGPDSDSALNPPVPYHDTAMPPCSTSEAIGHLPPLQAGQASPDIPNHVCRNLTEINRLRLMSVKPGEPNFGFAESRYGDLSLACHARLSNKSKRGFGDVYTRIHPDRPSPTITTRFHSISNGRFGHYDDAQVRGLSLREGALLQSFREDYEFYGEGMDSIARMIGNAVPPRLSEYMASWLYDLWAENFNSTAKSRG